MFTEAKTQSETIQGGLEEFSGQHQQVFSLQQPGCEILSGKGVVNQWEATTSSLGLEIPELLLITLHGLFKQCQIAGNQFSVPLPDRLMLPDDGGGDGFIQQAVAD